MFPCTEIFGHLFVRGLFNIYHPTRPYPGLCVCVFFCVTQQPNSDLDRLVLEASRWHQLDTPPVGLLWTSDRLVAEAAT